MTPEIADILRTVESAGQMFAVFANRRQCDDRRRLATTVRTKGWVMWNLATGRFELTSLGRVALAEWDAGGMDNAA